MPKATPGKLSDLTPDSRNANKGTQRGLRMLDHSLRNYGAGRSIVTDKNDVILAGNKTAERCADVGIENTITVETDGTQLVVVKRTDLDLEHDPRARELAYADNRVGQVDLEWDLGVVMEDIAAGVKLDGFDFEDILPPQPKGDDPGAQIDKAAELQEKWQTSTGQLWQLGNHRLIVGDCTDKATVERVMAGEKAGAVVTDPPYGLGDAKSFNKDHQDYEDDVPFDLTKLDLSVPFVIWGGQYYDWLPFARNEIGWVVWDKRPDLEGDKRERADRIFGQHFEIAVTSIGDLRGKMYRQRWGGYYGSQEIFHKTQKPPELFEWCIMPTEGIVIDYFLGSGTCIIACERLGRKCRAVEISPAYCAVAIQRWVDMTGSEPLLLQSQVIASTDEQSNG